MKILTLADDFKIANSKRRERIAELAKLEKDGTITDDQRAELDRITGRRGRPPVPPPLKIPTRIISFQVPESVAEMADAMVKEASELKEGSVTRSDLFRVLFFEVIKKKLYEGAQWGITCPKDAYVDAFPQYQQEYWPNNNEMYRTMLAERYETKADAENRLKEFITSTYGYENGYQRRDFVILAFNEKGKRLPDELDPYDSPINPTRDAIMKVIGRDFDVNDMHKPSVFEKCDSGL